MRANKHVDNIKGFTLVELSIVLVIISLILGASLKGQEMIKSAELKSIMKTVAEYKSAVSQFKSLYESLPGDMADATSYWPAVTTNGNGDLEIAAETSNEAFAALDQLALANLIGGTYSGTWGNAFTLNGNVTKTERFGVGLYIKCCSGTDYSRTLDFNNHISLFSIYSDDDYRSGAVSPTEARNIDKKLDDGIPDFGFVGGSGSYAPSAYSSTGCYSGTGSTSVYLSNDATYKDTDSCQMQFAYDWD